MEQTADDSFVQNFILFWNEKGIKIVKRIKFLVSLSLLVRFICIGNAVCLQCPRCGWSTGGCEPSESGVGNWTLRPLEEPQALNYRAVSPAQLCKYEFEVSVLWRKSKSAVLECCDSSQSSCTNFLSELLSGVAWNHTKCPIKTTASPLKCNSSLRCCSFVV